MLQRFKNWDVRISKYYPKIWILGVHIYLPILTIMPLTVYAFGWAYNITNMPPMREVNDYGYGLLQFAILPMLLAGIMYFIRQIKFNSLRVHHHLPYKNPYLSFITFVIVFFIITATPFTAGVGMHHKFSKQIDERQFIEDLSILNKGYSHFYQKEFTGVVYAASVSMVSDSDLEVDQSPEGKQTIVETYRLDKATGNLILYREIAHSEVDGNYIGDTSLRCYERYGWDTISVAQAHQEMHDFIDAAPRYYGEIKDKDVQKIFKQHILHVAKYRDTEDYNSPDFNQIGDRNRFESTLGTYSAVITKDDVFIGSSLGFWLYYIIFSLSLSTILFIVCSVRIIDFGWSMLVVALTGMFVMIANGLLTVFRWLPSNTEIQFNLILITVLVVIFMLLIRAKWLKSSISKAFTIALQLLLPATVFAYFGLFDNLHDCPYRGENWAEQCKDFEYFTNTDYYLMAYGICVLASLFGVYVFNRIYIRQYVHPKQQ